ncbi:cohesin subunit SA-2 isoform X1 [Siniperca chuatsi]|uniref:cohesin subunit SA-2 isoform X1 n=2 Tax=Siniperca chuatsi TaxID=119488 RepID=UPI001CE16B67|nr:cohesin subunit SA-2 isoform X1 [Siniperca chuatsi]XP_044073155.1 cohesin subunit SA-2 isoform X1 [Siniperca chuatsi]XP_044073156.1 cohesin subunit SA-2 isoform X1 [Siniperca chuatsi]XP_044073158.1 cohesin subunit SA-2 isoform X1 [Siniperca chuatsi]
MIPEPTATAASRQNKNSHDEANSSAAVNHSEDESGNENRQKSVRRRKRAHKGSENVKCKSAKASRSSVSRAGGSHGKRRHVEAVTLFEVVTMGRSAMQAVIDDWIEAYVTDRDSSLLDLISFFIQCSGCKGVVTAEMCQSKEDSEVMSKMVEELDEVAGLQYKKFLAFPWILTVTWPMDTDSVEYPLIQSGPYGRWFHSEFCDFVSVLVAQCQHSVIFDSYLMNTLISLLTELSNSYVRAFRHTCTLAAVKLLSSLVAVALSLSVGIENSQKLFEVQKTKTMRQKSTLQLERIQKKITELQEKRAEIESMMDIIFKGVFLKRYRDVLPEIRSICMEELGLWMKLYSSAFLTDSYLKYMGWMMHDKIPDVRLKCVLGLQDLYGDPLLLPKLDLFTSRFKDRMISMTLDKDNEVAVQTMKLLLLISKTSDDVLSPEDYKQLLQFVFSSQRPLAATAGELLFSRLLNTVAPASDTQDEINEDEAHKQQTFARLKALLQFYQESELHKHVVYLVDSLWDCGGALLKDWPTLTSILLQDPSSHSPGLTQAEQAVLVEILVASVRQASEGPALAGRSGAKKVMSAREKKIQTDDCTKLTEHLLVVLPKLLSKFSSSCDVVASLMKIPQYFLPECPEAENTQSISGLMAVVGAVLDRHSGPAVLEAAACTYLSLCGEETAWCSMVLAARDSLVQRWVDRLTALLGDSLTGDSFSADEEKTGDILATLKKLRAFHNCHDLLRWNLFELLSPILSVESSQGGAPPEVLLEVLQCLCYSMLWSLNTSSETLTSRDKAVAQRLQLRLFCERGHHCLSHSDHSVRQQAFLGVCDVLTAHSYQLQVWDPTSFGPLLYTPTPKLQRALLTFVCVNIFVGADCDSQSSVSENSEVERLEDLHKRRNLLAAYCKLIVHGVLEMSMAAEVFMHYMKYYNDFGDIIKETMYRTRQIDKIESARTLVLCLQQLFVRLKREQESGGRAQSRVQTFTSIKELARRFALTFGDLVKFRECVVMIHRNGIEFVFQEFSQTPETPTPSYLSYLTILSEFSSKLLKPDKKTVFSYLQKHTAEHIIDLREECWQPLIYYRASLLAVAEGEDAVSYVSSDRKPYLPNRSPFSKQKLEGSKSPGPFSPVDSRVSKVHRSSFSPSHQEKTADMDPFAVPVEPPAKRLNIEGSVPSTGNEADDDTVEVEL